MKSKSKGIRAIGKKEFEDHLNGKKITYKGGVLAKCYDCMCYYIDGKIDCRNKKCPLYPWMPYKEQPS